MLDAMSIPVTEQQFSGIAAKVRADNPDVIYIASYGAQELQLIKQLRDNGLTQQIASYSALAIPGTLALPQAKGALYTTQHMDWSSADPVTKRFVDDYTKKYNKQPTAYVANYYNAVRLFALLAQDLEKHKQPITGENLLKARKSMKTFDMVGGKMVFNENGTVTMPIQVNEVEDQASKIVYAGK
jgi:ABC-type branched-subunit amino acid transport system substrate-binding protein